MKRNEVAYLLALVLRWLEKVSSSKILTCLKKLIPGEIFFISDFDKQEKAQLKFCAHVRRVQSHVKVFKSSRSYCCYGNVCHEIKIKNAFTNDWAGF